jgi:hypothetical protein
MPTHDEEDTFWRDYAQLSPEQRKAFAVAIVHLVDDLKSGGGLRKGLRVKRVQGHPGVFELTWADDGRATFHYGQALVAGELHIVWRRIGTHDILKDP